MELDRLRRKPPVQTRQTCIRDYSQSFAEALFGIVYIYRHQRCIT